jgi:hypothetical protein
MTPRENMLKVIRHEMPDWIPVVCHVDPYNQPSRKGMDPELDADLGEVQWSDGAGMKLSQYLGIDILDWTPNPIRQSFRTVEVENRQNGQDVTTTWHTPQGDLRQIRRTAADNRTSYLVEHFIKSPDDLAAFMYAMNDQQFEIAEDAAAEIRKRGELIGDQGLQSKSMPGTPLGMLIRVYAGPETAAYLTVDAPDALRDLFSVMEDNHMRQFTKVIEQSDIEVYLGMDDTSTTTQSPAMFEKYCVDYTNRVADYVHSQGRFYWHHSCGLIRDLLPLYRSTRMNGVHAYTVPPTGDARIRDGKEILGESYVIVTGLKMLEGPMTDRDAAADQVRQMFEEAAPGSNFILNMTCYQHQPVSAMEWLRDECMKYTEVER